MFSYCIHKQIRQRHNTNSSRALDVHPSRLQPSYLPPFPRQVPLLIVYIKFKWSPSLPTRLLAPVYGSLTVLALLHRLPPYPRSRRCWDEWAGGVFRRRAHDPAAGTRLMKRSRAPSLSLPGSVVCPGRRWTKPTAVRWGGVGGQGCAGSVRLAPACSITKGRIVRCRRV